MKLIIDIDEKDYAMLKNTSITPDWNTLWHGKEKDKELTFATFNLVKALTDGISYYENDRNTYCHGIVNCKYYRGECIFMDMGSGNPDDMPCRAQESEDLKAFREWKEQKKKGNKEK